MLIILLEERQERVVLSAKNEMDVRLNHRAGNVIGIISSVTIVNGGITGDASCFSLIKNSFR